MINLCVPLRPPSYRWSIPEVASDTTVPAPPLKWTLKQSTLTLDGGEKTVLKNEVQGGRKPIQFGLQGTPNGFSIDASTGTVTLDNATVRAAAVSVLEMPTSQKNRRISLVSAMLEQKRTLEDHASQLLGRTTLGLPVILPVPLIATDADLTTSMFNYYVIVEIPPNDYEKHLSELDEKQAAQDAEMLAKKELQMKGSGLPNGRIVAGGVNPAELEDVKRKLRALKERVDLMIRQMNELLDKLADEKK